MKHQSIKYGIAYIVLIIFSMYLSGCAKSDNPDDQAKEKTINESFYLISQGKYQEAKNKIISAGGENNSNPILLNNLAVLLAMDRYYDKALSVFSKAESLYAPMNVSNIVQMLPVVDTTIACFLFAYATPGYKLSTISTKWSAMNGEDEKLLHKGDGMTINLNYIDYHIYYTDPGVVNYIGPVIEYYPQKDGTFEKKYAIKYRKQKDLFKHFIDETTNGMAYKFESELRMNELSLRLAVNYSRTSH